MPDYLFSYTLSRPYPFKWFTPITFLGGGLFTVFISLLNIAAVGYKSRYIHAILTKMYIVDLLISSQCRPHYRYGTDLFRPLITELDA